MWCLHVVTLQRNLSCSPKQQSFVIWSESLILYDRLKMVWELRYGLQTTCLCWLNQWHHSTFYCPITFVLNLWLSHASSRRYFFKWPESWKITFMAGFFICPAWLRLKKKCTLGGSPVNKTLLLYIYLSNSLHLSWLNCALI